MEHLENSILQNRPVPILALLPQGGHKKNREKMCKTYARHCIGSVQKATQWDSEIIVQLGQICTYSMFHYIINEKSNFWVLWETVVGNSYKPTCPGPLTLKAYHQTIYLVMDSWPATLKFNFSGQVNELKFGTDRLRPQIIHENLHLNLWNTLLFSDSGLKPGIYFQGLLNLGLLCGELLFVLQHFSLILLHLLSMHLFLKKKKNRERS